MKPAGSHELALPCLPVFRSQRGASLLTAQGVSGQTIPSQFDVLARWDDGSVKWVLVSLIVPKIQAHGRFRFDVIESQQTETGDGWAVRTLDRGVHVQYPSLSVTSNGLGLPQSIEIQNAAGRVALVAGDTQLRLQGQALKSEQARLLSTHVEEQGPVRTVIRTHGELSLDANTSFGFVSRITVFCNGQISTSYTVINQQVHRFHGFGVQFALADGFQQVQFQQAAVRLPETVADDAEELDEIGVRQTSAQSAVFLGDNFRNKPVMTSYHGGLRLIGESNGKSLGLAIHDFWQRYPSELAVTTNRGRLWFYPDNKEKASPLYRVGRAARSDFTIKVAAGGVPESSLAELGLTDLHAFADVQWYRDSGALGNYAVGDFQLPTGTYHLYVQEHMTYLQRRNFLANEFGFWDFGDGGQPDSAFRRNNEFGISYAMLFHYLCTGDVRFFEEGVAFAKHFRDVDTLHAGAMKGKSIRHTDNHVEGGSGYDTAHQWVEGMLLAYLLTGDRRSLEVAREMAIPLIEFAQEMSTRLKAKPITIPVNERSLGWTLLSLMILKDVTNDRRYTDAIQALVDGVVASQDQERGHWPRPLPHEDFPTGGSPFMLGVLTEALMRHHEKTGDPAVARSIVKSSY